MSDINVTSQVGYGAIDEEMLPLQKCVCGEKFELWDAVLSIYPINAWECPKCKRRLYFRSSITVFEVHP